MTEQIKPLAQVSEAATSDQVSVVGYGTTTIPAGKTYLYGLLGVDASNFYQACITVDKAAPNTNVNVTKFGWYTYANGNNSYHLGIENNGSADVTVNIKLLKVTS